MLTVSQITTLSWLAKEGEIDAAGITRELAASCYQACLPKDGWDDEFWMALEELRGRKKDDIKEYLENDLIVASARKIALNESLGHPQLIQKLNIRKLLENASDQAHQMSDAARERGYEEGAQFVRRSVVAKRRERANELARILVRLLEITFTALGGMGLLLAFLPFSEKPVIARVLTVATSLTLGTVSLLALMGFKIPSRPFGLLTSKVSNVIYWIQGKLVPPVR